MKLFGRKKEAEAIDDRTEVERTFEEKGQVIGKKAGEIAQKGINKFKDVSEKIDAKEKLDKVDEFADKAIEKGKVAVSKAASKTKEALNKNFNKAKDE